MQNQDRVEDHLNDQQYCCNILVLKFSSPPKIDAISSHIPLAHPPKKSPSHDPRKRRVTLGDDVITREIFTRKRRVTLGDDVITREI